MTVAQIYELTNTIFNEVTGGSAVLNEDLSNVVDCGNTIIDTNQVDNFVKKLVDRIAKVNFVNRPYSGSVPSLYKDSFEYGSVVQKIYGAMPTAISDDEWKLENGKAYPTDIFYQPSVSNKFYNSKTAFRINMSFATKQVKSAFGGAGQLNAFLSMLTTNVDNAITIRVDELIMRVIASMIVDTFHNAFHADTNDYTTVGDTRCINLLKLYNERFGTTLKKDDAITSPEFIRFASFVMGIYKDRLTKMSKLFNIAGEDRFTKSSDLHVVALADFVESAKAYLYSNTYHENFVTLPDAETVPYWQGCGTSYAMGDIATINAKSGAGNSFNANEAGVYILAIMFDNNAMGVSNISREVTSGYNPNGNFYTNYYNVENSFWNDNTENFVVFYIA